MRSHSESIRSQPQPSTCVDEIPHGFSYGFRQVLGREDRVSPLEMPDVSIPVTDLLV